MAVCSQIHTKHINTAVWAERRIVNVKLAVHTTYSDHWGLKPTRGPRSWAQPGCGHF